MFLFNRLFINIVIAVVDVVGFYSLYSFYYAPSYL